MFRYLCVFIFLLLCFELHSQDLIEIYKNDIPEKIFQDKNLKRQVGYELESLKVDPALIYDYFVYLRLAYNVGIANADSNNMENYISKKTEAAIKRSTWAKQRRSISVYSRDLFSFIKYFPYRHEFYKRFYTERSIKNKIDTTLARHEDYSNYIMYKYFADAPGLIFERGLDYKLLLDKEVRRVVQVINKMYLGSKGNRKNSYKAAQWYIERYLFLFKNSYSNSFAVSTDMGVNPFLKKFVTGKDNQDFSVYCTFGFGRENYHQNITSQFFDIPFPVPHPELGIEFSAKTQFSIESYRSYGIGIQIPLRKQRGILSYFDLSLLYIDLMNSKVKTDIYGEPLFRRYKEFLSDKSVYYTKRYFPDYDFYFQTFELHCSVPVLYITNFTWIEAGLYMQYYKYSSAHSCSSRMEYDTENPNSEYLSDYHIEGAMESQFKFIPEVGICAKMVKGIALRTTFSPNKVRFFIVCNII